MNIESMVGVFIMKVVFWILAYFPAVNSLAKGCGGSPYSVMPWSYGEELFYMNAEFFLGIGIFLGILTILVVCMLSLYLEQQWAMRHWAIMASQVRYRIQRKK